MIWPLSGPSIRVMRVDHGEIFEWWVGMEWSYCLDWWVWSSRGLLDARAWGRGSGRSHSFASKSARSTRTSWWSWSHSRFCGAFSCLSSSTAWFDATSEQPSWAFWPILSSESSASFGSRPTHLRPCCKQQPRARPLRYWSKWFLELMKLRGSPIFSFCVVQ